MSIGYACLAVGVRGADFKSCVIRNASRSRLLQLTEHNLNSLERIIDYNEENNIKLFRISSGLIPFGSYVAKGLPWHEIFHDRFLSIGHKIKANGIRVSMHPGQYTVLNSPDKDTVANSIADLIYHNRVLDALGLGQEHKIILHIGGAYGNKKLAAARFATNFEHLDPTIRQRLVIENDDRSYNISEVLDIGTNLSIPVVYDNLHNQSNCADVSKSDYFWIDECRKIWGAMDGRQKIHYSQQNPDKRTGSHSFSIRINEFMSFYSGLGERSPDIMLEVKDKNLSALKCISCVSGSNSIRDLETEWSRYKYTVLERAPESYNSVRKMLRNKDDYPALSFYLHIENALDRDISAGNFTNTALHVWSYFKDKATEKEKAAFHKTVSAGGDADSMLRTKRMLKRLAFKYEIDYLLDSYYFLF